MTIFMVIGILGNRNLQIRLLPYATRTYVSAPPMPLSAGILLLLWWRMVGGTSKNLLNISTSKSSSNTVDTFKRAALDNFPSTGMNLMCLSVSSPFSSSKAMAVPINWRSSSSMKLSMILESEEAQKRKPYTSSVSTNGIMLRKSKHFA